MSKQVELVTFRARTNHFNEIPYKRKSIVDIKIRLLVSLLANIIVVSFGLNLLQSAFVEIDVLNNWFLVNNSLEFW